MNKDNIFISNNYFYNTDSSDSSDSSDSIHTDDIQLIESPNTDDIFNNFNDNYDSGYYSD